MGAGPAACSNVGLHTGEEAAAQNKSMQQGVVVSLELHLNTSSLSQNAASRAVLRSAPLRLPVGLRLRSHVWLLSARVTAGLLGCSRVLCVSAHCTQALLSAAFVYKPQQALLQTQDNVTAAIHLYSPTAIGQNCS